MTVLIKQINPTTKAKINPPRYKKDLLIYLYIKLLFAKLVKLVYDKPIIYKDTPQGKISGYFSKLHLESCTNEVVRLF